jgi:hypothetical protein
MPQALGMLWAALTVTDNFAAEDRRPWERARRGPLSLCAMREPVGPVEIITTCSGVVHSLGDILALSPDRCLTSYPSV